MNPTNMMTNWNYSYNYYSMTWRMPFPLLLVCLLYCLIRPCPLWLSPLVLHPYLLFLLHYHSICLEYNCCSGYKRHVTLSYHPVHLVFTLVLVHIICSYAHRPFILHSPTSLCMCTLCPPTGLCTCTSSLPPLRTCTCRLLQSKISPEYSLIR